MGGVCGVAAKPPHHTPQFPRMPSSYAPSYKLFMTSKISILLVITEMQAAEKCLPIVLRTISLATLSCGSCHSEKWFINPNYYSLLPYNYTRYKTRYSGLSQIVIKNRIIVNKHLITPTLWEKSSLNLENTFSKCTPPLRNSDFAIALTSYSQSVRRLN